MNKFNRFLNFKFIFILGITALLFFAHSLQAAVPSTVTKLPSAPFSGQIDLGGSTDHIYHFTNDVIIDSPSDITGNRTGVIFIDGNLTIGPMPGNKLQSGTANSGLVFVVKGDVNINKVMTTIDAMIISEGTICTASEGDPPACPSGLTDPATTSQLVINGSLISLNPAKPIKFRRALSNNSRPAEKINHQVKYLVILRDLISDTYQKWTEIP